MTWQLKKSSFMCSPGLSSYTILESTMAIVIVAFIDFVQNVDFLCPY